MQPWWDSLQKAARASLYIGGDECHPVKIYPFQQFEISSRGGSRAGIPLVVPGTTRAWRSNSGRRISNVKLPCSRGDTAIKTRRIVRRINMSVLDISNIVYRCRAASKRGLTIRYYYTTSTNSTEEANE